MFTAACSDTFIPFIMDRKIEKCMTLLILGLIVACILKNSSRRRISNRDNFDANMKSYYYVRIYFEQSFLFIIRKLRRKRSERKRANRLVKSSYGNRRDHHLKILSWNSGHSYLIHQMNEVKWLLQDKAPHILFISESNHHFVGLNLHV